MQMDSTTQETGGPAPHAVPEFINGQHARLRPVLEPDLPALARLMAQAPLAFNWEGEIWTAQSLRKKFEDEKEPGLWTRTKKHLAITDREGALCGVLQDELGRLGGCELSFHLAEHRPDRGTLGPDALAAFVEYKRSWQHCPRIETMLLEPQAAEREWLLACGFAAEVHCQEAWLFQGRLVALDVYGWLAPWTAANRAPGGIGQ
jgi:hypothetical protein